MSALFTRRRFVIGGLQVTAAVPLMSLLARSRPHASSGERALVVVQLTGGNDSLNMVVPHRQDAYFKLRPTLGLARASLHRLDDDHGLHPSMAGVAKLFADGRVAIVHGVGYPEPNRSHFRAMEIWHSGEPDKPLGSVGWMGRLADQLAERDATALTALHIGDGDLPFALRGEKFFAPSVDDASSFRVREVPSAVAQARATLLDARDGSSELAYVREAARATYRTAERMAQVAARPAKAEYPATELARRLQLVARLVTADFGTRLFHVELGGFDTHSRQAPIHAALLTELSNALAAFYADLAANSADSSVLTFVFSEFARRVEENGSKGTDHGAAAPVLLLGGTLRAGLHGTPPDLSRLVDGDVPFTTDFRAVYATLEQRWLKVTAPPGFTPLDLIA
jgi:uncharacterized protein (DUF1501 family)